MTFEKNSFIYLHGDRIDRVSFIVSGSVILIDSESTRVTKLARDERNFAFFQKLNERSKGEERDFLLNQKGN